MTHAANTQPSSISICSECSRNIRTSEIRCCAGYWSLNKLYYACRK